MSEGPGTTWSRSRRRLVTGLVIALALSAGPVTAAAALPGGVDRCRPNPSGHVPPGCRHVVDGAIEELLAPTLPNLVPKPPAVVVLREVAGQPMVAFATVIVNRGDYALDLLHEPAPNPDAALQEWSAAQCVGWVGPVCRERRSAGSFTYHSSPGHEHWHFDGFALYELRRLGADGSPDFSFGGLIGEAEKVSFCLQDSQQEEADAGLAFYSGCARLYQGISPGWADVYHERLSGQRLPIGGLPDARYALVYTIDPDGRLFESDETDNVAWSTIELSGGGTAVEVVTDP